MSCFLMLSFVTTNGVNSADGVLKTFEVGCGVCPWRSLYAASAAADATILIGLLILLYCVSGTMRCAAAVSESLPVTGGTGFTPAVLIAEMAPPPVPSLAATSAKIWLWKR